MISIQSVTKIRLITMSSYAGVSEKVHFITKCTFRSFLQFSAYCLVHPAINSKLRQFNNIMCLPVLVFMFCGIEPLYPHYDVIVLVSQCLQTSQNSTEYMFGCTTVVTPQMLLAMHKAHAVPYLAYQVWANEDNWFLLSCRFLAECRARYCPQKAHRMPNKPPAQSTPAARLPSEVPSRVDRTNIPFLKRSGIFLIVISKTKCMDTREGIRF
jgi:hypothetical protein